MMDLKNEENNKITIYPLIRLILFFRSLSKKTDQKKKRNENQITDPIQKAML